MLSIIILNFIAQYQDAVSSKRKNNPSENTTKPGQCIKYQNWLGTKWINWESSRPAKEICFI